MLYERIGGIIAQVTRWLVSGAAAFQADQQTTQVIIVFENAPCAARHAGHRVISQVGANIDFTLQAFGETAQLTGSTSHTDTAFPPLSKSVQ